MLSADRDELEEVLKESDELVFSFAVGEEDREEDGEVAGAEEDLLGYFFGELAGLACSPGDVVERRGTAE